MVFPKLKRRLSYLFTSEGRDFLRLYRSCAKRRRYRPLKDVSFGGLSFDVPDAPSFFWQYVDIFKNQSYLFRSDTSSPVIYDCGANVGVSVAYFKSLYPDARVVAFEPDKEIYGYLSRNLSRNNLLEDVALHNAAVWTHAKGVSFASDGADGGHVEECSGGRVVPSVDLKEMLLGEKRVDLLKMDIEGAETVVIPTLKHVLNRVRNLFCEYHSWGTERNGTERNGTERNGTERWGVFWQFWTRLASVIGSFPWEALRQLLSSIKASPGRSIFSRSTRAFRDMFIAASSVEAGES